MARRYRIAVAVLVAGAVTGVTGASAPAQSPCGSHPWCDRSLSPERRADLVLAAMTQDEKFELMAGDDPFGVATGEPANGTSQGVPRLGIPTMYFNDGPVGLRKGRATGLPSSTALAAAFNPAMARRYGELLGYEADRKGIHVVHAPAVNIMRVEEGGRTFEYFGEDPFLAARTSVPFSQGMQAKGVMANVKHYVANNQETDRFTTNAVVDERTLREIYMPAFEETVKSGVGSVMISYNRVNGRSVTEHAELVNGILKREWAFPGFALTDYAAAQRSTADAANAGTDLELPQAAFYSKQALALAVATGAVKPAVVDEHVHRILRTMFRFGAFDGARAGDNKIDVSVGAGVARDVAEDGMVLLKNERGMLPLDAGRLKSVAVIGPEANAYRAGGGSSAVNPFHTVTPYDGIRRKLAGKAEVSLNDGRDARAAADVARRADVAVVVVNDAQAEFADKPCLSLQCGDPTNGDQDGLIEAVAAANRNTIVLLEVGGPVLMPWIGKVPAAVQAWYPGQDGGTAIARVLFGDTDPGGRLPQSFPRREEDPPTAGHPERYPGVAENAQYSEGVFMGYRHYDEKGIAPLFPFGHGLSYTSFDYRDLEIRPDRRRPGHATLEITVRNSGKRTGKEVAQLYVGMPEGPVQQPPSWLKGFEKVELGAGKSKRLRFSLDPRSFSYWDAASDSWRIARGCYRLSIASSSRDIRARGIVSQGGAVCPRNCATATGRLRGKVLGRARLGRNRERHRDAFPSFEERRRGYDTSCLSGGRHIRIGYLTGSRLRRLSRGTRRRVRDRAVIALASHPRYRVRGVRRGTTVRRARKRLKGLRRTRIGRNVWYTRRGRPATIVLRTRGKRVRSVGIADRRLTKSRKATRRLLHGFTPR